MKMMWSFLLLMNGLFAFAQSGGDQILGNWASENGNTKFEIYKSGETYAAKIVEMKEPNKADGTPKIDVNNPKVEKRKQALIGLVIVKNLTYKNGKWTGGTIYSPEKGVTVNCEMTLLSNGDLQITASKSWVSKQRIWKRA